MQAVISRVRCQRGLGAAAFAVAISHSSHTHSVFHISASSGSLVTLVSTCTHVSSVGLGENGAGGRAGSASVFHGAEVSLFPVTSQVSGTHLAPNKLLIEWMDDQVNNSIQAIKVFLSGEIFCPDQQINNNNANLYAKDLMFLHFIGCS